MGRATINANLDSGSYNIHIDTGSEKLTARRTTIAARLAELATLISDKEAKLEADSDPAIEAALVQELENAGAAYEAAVKKHCTPENWAADPVRSELDVWLEAILDVGEVRQDVYDWNAEIVDFSKQKTEAEQQLAIAADQLDAAEQARDDAHDSYISALEDLAARQYECLYILQPPDPTPACYAEQAALVEYWEFEWSYLALVVVPPLQDTVDGLTTDIANLDSQIAQRETWVSEAEPRIEKLQEDADAAQKVYKDAVLKAREHLVKCDPLQFIPQMEKISAAQVQLSKYRADIKKQTAAVAMYKAEQFNLRVEDAKLELIAQYIGGQDLQAWCADYTTDANAGAAVGTIEVPGEKTRLIVVPACAEPTDGDGRLVARQAMTSAQAFWNAAVLPGWAKWMPMYRIGEIIDIDYDEDTASVFLVDDVPISAHSVWPTNKPSFRGAAMDVDHPDKWQLDDIPVEYMTCNAAAFLVGDRVVIKFEQPALAKTDPQTGSNPMDPAAIQTTIIGFESHPYDCPGIKLIDLQGEGVGRYEQHFFSWNGEEEPCSELAALPEHITIEEDHSLNTTTCAQPCEGQIWCCGPAIRFFYEFGDGETEIYRAEGCEAFAQYYACWPRELDTPWSKWHSQGEGIAIYANGQTITRTEWNWYTDWNLTVPDGCYVQPGSVNGTPATEIIPCKQIVYDDGDGTTTTSYWWPDGYGPEKPPLEFRKDGLKYRLRTDIAYDIRQLTYEAFRE